VLSENSSFQKFSVSSLKKGEKSQFAISILQILQFALKRKEIQKENHWCKICPKIKIHSGGEWGAAFKI